MIKKTTLVIALLLITALAGLFLYGEYQTRSAEHARLEELAGTLGPIEDQILALEAQLRDAKTLYEKTLAGKPTVILYFEQSDSNLAKEAYPLLKAYGFPGTYSAGAVRTALTPQEVQTLLAAGWEANPPAVPPNLVVAKLNSTDAAVTTALEKLLAEGGTLAISTRYVAEEVPDPLKDAKTSKYKQILETLKEKQANGSLQVLTTTQALRYAETVAAGKPAALKAYEQAKTDLENRIAALKESRAALLR